MEKTQLYVVIVAAVLVVGAVGVVVVFDPFGTPTDELVFCGIFPIVQRPDAGPDRRDGFLIAIDEINADPASVGLPTNTRIKAVALDDNNDAAGGTTAAQTCVAEGADIVIGSSGSSVSAAIANVLTPEKIVQISYASSSPSLTNRTQFPYFMRVAASDADQGRAVADIITSFGWTDGALLYTTDSYGSGLPAVVKTELGTDVTWSSEQTFDPKATDVSAQVSAIKSSSAEFLVLHAIDVDAKTAFKEIGVAWDKPIIITDGSSTTATFAGDDDVKAAMDNVIGTTPAALTGAGYDAFNTTWFDTTTCGESQTGGATSCGAGRTNAVPNSYAPFAYDAVYVAAKGFANADSRDADDLLDALYDVTFSGASAEISFNEFGEVNGRYDIVHLDGDTYGTIGTWTGTVNFSASSVTLRDGTTWTLSGSTATPP